MKKFLTVLLALSVVFTYSFSAVGTVFADDTVTAAPTNTQAQYMQNLAKAEEQVLKTLGSEYALAKAQVTHAGDCAYATGSYVIAGAEWLKQLDAVYADEQTTVKARTAALQTAAEYALHGDDEIDELVALYTVKNAAGLTTALYAADGTYAAAAAKVQFAADKSKYVSYANSVDTTIYTLTEQSAAYPTVTYGTTTVTTKVPKEYADTVIAKLVYDINAIVLADTDTSAAAIATKAGQIESAFDDVLTVNDAQTAYIIDESTTNIKSIAEEKADETQSAADKAALQADLAARIANAATSTTGFDADQLAAWNKLKDAYSAVSTYLINNGAASNNPFPAYTLAKENGETKANETATSYQKVVADVEELTAVVNALKAQKDVDGNAAYDAADVDDVAATKLADMYGAAARDQNYAPVSYAAKVAWFDGAKLTYLSAFNKEHAKAVVADKVNADEMKYNNNAYYAAEWADVAAAVAAFNTAIDAAQTTTDITKAEGDLTTAIGKIKKAAEVDDLYAAGVCKANAEAAWTMVTNYVAALNTGKDAKDQITNPFENQAALNTWFAENGARTADAVKALYETLKAEVAKTPTAAEKDAASAEAVAKVKALVAALPTALNATLADADAAVAAKAAYDALTATEKAQLTSENAKLTALIANLETLYNTEITAKIADANKGGITVEDAAIFDELEKLNEAYKALHGSDNSAYDTFMTANKTTLKNAERDAVINAIKAIPARVTLADKEAVEAARKAYEAYVEKYTDYAAGVNAANDITNIGTLQMAEAILSTLDAAAVEGLKITASSTAAKGSITVKWTVKGDTSAADGFEVFRSVKKNSGYTTKAFFTTDKNTKRSYKNTKSLKKGTRYYYKVRAYKVLADGTKVYSDWSNKAYRIAK